MARVRMARPWLPLVLILLLALVLRLLRLDERNLWYDEAFSILFASKGLAAMLAGTLTPVDGGAADIHPLLYYVLLDIWMAVFGVTALAARLFSVLLGVATVGAVYGLSRDLFDQRVGLAAAFVVTLAPFHIQYSQEARMYSLLALLLVLATWVYIRARQARGSWRGALVFGVLASLAMYTQQLAAFYLVSLALHAMASRNRRMLRWLALGACVALLLYLPWLMQLPAQWSKVGAYYWVPMPNLLRLLLTLRVFFAGVTELAPQAALLSLGGALFVTVLLGLHVLLVWRRLSSDVRRSLRLVLWLVVMPVIGLWLVSQFRPVYLERALLPSALMLYIAIGWLLAASNLPRLLAAGIGMITLAVAGSGLVSVLTWDWFPNSPHRQAAALIADDWQTGDVVVHQLKLSALPMLVYAPQLDQRFVRDVPGSPDDTLAEPTRHVLGVEALDCVQVAGREANRIWYVTYTGLAAQAELVGRTDIAAGMVWLDAHFDETEHWRLNDLDVMLYSAPDASARNGVCI